MIPRDYRWNGWRENASGVVSVMEFRHKLLRTLTPTPTTVQPPSDDAPRAGFAFHALRSDLICIVRSPAPAVRTKMPGGSPTDTESLFPDEVAALERITQDDQKAFRAWWVAHHIFAPSPNVT